MQSISIFMWGVWCTPTLSMTHRHAFSYPKNEQPKLTVLPLPSSLLYTARSLIWPTKDTMIKACILDDDSNEIVLDVNHTETTKYSNQNHAQSPIAHTIFGTDDRNEKGKPSWSV